MTDDREPFREARAAGLKARQERRLENATYTAAEVKVLTEAALRLGRKEAFDEIDVAFDRITYASDDGTEYEHNDGCQGEAECPACWVAAIRGVLQDLAPQLAGRAPEPRTEPSGYSDLPQDSQAGMEACRHCGAYGGNGRIYRQDDTWDSCPVCTRDTSKGGGE